MFLPVSHVKRLEDVPVCDLHDNDVHGQHDGHQKELDSRRKLQKNGNGNKTHHAG